MSCGRAPALRALTPGPGGPTSWRGRGRGLSLLTPTTPPSTPHQSLGRGLPLPCSPDLSPPLEDYSPPRRHQEAPLRQPHTMPCCLQPHGRCPAPTPMLSMIQMPPTV